MTERRDDDRGDRRKDAPPPADSVRPRRDLGPAAPSASSFEWARPLRAWSLADEFTNEAIELAALRAEAAVVPFLRSRREPWFHGVSVIELVIPDAATLASLRRTRSVRFTRACGAWRLLRRWAGAHGDGGLDEAMCSAAATYLNSDFAGLLKASVVTWVIRDR